MHGKAVANLLGDCEVPSDKDKIVQSLNGAAVGHFRANLDSI